MYKNLLIAALLGTCVIGVTACSKGEENKSTTTDQATQTSAMATPQDSNQPQAAPVQTADNSSMTGQPAPEATTNTTSQPAGQQTADNSSAMAPAAGSAPAADAPVPATGDATAPATGDAAAPATGDAAVPASTDSNTSAPATN
jgi:hypothetical protein